MSILGFSTEKFVCLICGRQVSDSDFGDICVNRMCPACNRLFVVFKNRVKQKINGKMLKLSKNKKYWQRTSAMNKERLYPFRSSLEKKAFNIIREILLFEEVKINEFHDWLVNYESNHKLSLDFFFPEFDLAIEIDGFRHYDSSADQSFEDFCRRQELDQLKDKICKKNGVKLLRFNDAEVNREIISKKLRELNLVKK